MKYVPRGLPGASVGDGRRAVMVILALALVACMENGADPRSLVSEQLREIAAQRTDLSQLREALGRIEAFHTRHRTGLKLNPPTGRGRARSLAVRVPL